MKKAHLFNRHLLPLLSMLVYLLMTACSTPVRDENALFSAALSGDSVHVQKLLISGVDPDISRENGVTPLFLAAQHQRTAIVKQLLDNGAKIDGSGYRGATPLIVAATAGHQDVVSLLLARGANPDWRRNDGATALYMAAQEGHLEIVRQLLAAKATLDMPAYQKATALFIAAQSGHDAVVRELLDAGAAVEKGLPGNTTPLHAAVSKGHQDVVRLLVHSGADPRTASRQGDTAIDLARRQGNQTLLSLLEEAESGRSEQSGGSGQSGIATGSASVKITSQTDNSRADGKNPVQPVAPPTVKSSTGIEKPPRQETMPVQQDTVVALPPAPVIGPSEPKVQVVKHTAKKKPVQKAKADRPAENDATDTLAKNKVSPAAEVENDGDFDNEPSSFGWSTGNFLKSVDAATAPPVADTEKLPSVSQQQGQKATTPSTAANKKLADGGGNYLASLDAEAGAVAAGKNTAKSVSATVNTLLASGSGHYFRGEFKQAASEFLTLYKTYPDNPKAADALLQLSKTLAAMERKDASCTTLARLRKEYPKAWPRLAAEAGRLSKHSGCSLISRI